MRQRTFLNYSQSNNDEMKVKEQVCTIEQAKRLKALGIKQESIFSFYDSVIMTENEFDVSREHCNNPFTGEQYSAFTVAELGVMLWAYGFEQFGLTSISHASLMDNIFKGETEAEMRAAMLIYLLENKLLSQ